MGNRQILNAKFALSRSERTQLLRKIFLYQIQYILNTKLKLDASFFEVEDQDEMEEKKVEKTLLSRTTLMPRSSFSNFKALFKNANKVKSAEYECDAAAQQQQQKKKRTRIEFERSNILNEELGLILRKDDKAKRKFEKIEI